MLGIEAGKISKSLVDNSSSIDFEVQKLRCCRETVLFCALRSSLAAR
jgi:hypothetical protein